MTSQYEIIDGVRYLVTRNGQGEIIVKARAEEFTRGIDPDKADLAAFKRKQAKDMTVADVGRALQILLRKLS